jgi:flagellar biosynthesis protein FlhG
MAQAAGIRATSARSVSDVIAGKCSAREALVPGPAGALILANHSASRPNLDFSRHAQQRLLTELRLLRDAADIIVVDVGSGLSPWTRRFWLSGRLVLLVTTTDDLALMDAYASIKLNTADMPRPDLRVVANQCDSDAIATDTYRRLATACQRFLSRELLTLPPLPTHAAKNAASAPVFPRVWESPNTPFGHAALWLGRAVCDLLTPTVHPAANRNGTCVRVPRQRSLC